MNIAREVSTRSTCDRKFVGAVIVRDKSILATGYNGSPAGLPHCTEVGCLIYESKNPDGEIELNQGRKSLTLTVSNTGDRPIQVGSHYHFFETNPALKFERKKARGMRLDIAAGTAVRFEPGQSREVTLVALDGARTVYGFRQEVMGKL